MSLPSLTNFSDSPTHEPIARKSGIRMLPADDDHGPRIAGALRAGLRRWRALHRVKQQHAAALLGVSQSTISRWEEGRQAIEDREARLIEALVGARLTSAAESVLATLVRENRRSIHLVCDLTHRLLVCSPDRERSFAVPATELTGRSLWRYATEEVERAERLLGEQGWHSSLAPSPVEFDTGSNGSKLVPIEQGRCRWTRMTLSDGAAVRLVQTL